MVIWAALSLISPAYLLRELVTFGKAFPFLEKYFPFFLFFVALLNGAC